MRRIFLFAENSSKFTHESIDETIPLFYVTKDLIWACECLFFGFVGILRGEIIVSYITHLHNPRFGSIFAFPTDSYDIREFFEWEVSPFTFMPDNIAEKYLSHWIKLGSEPGPRSIEVFCNNYEIRIILLWAKSIELLQKFFCEELHKQIEKK